MAVWHRLSEQWDHVGSPFRPTPEDVAFAAAALRAMPNSGQAGALTSVLLGVTPELAAILSRTHNVEVDHSTRMLTWSWTKFPRGHLAMPLAARWTALPIKDRSVDAVFGDGCNIQLEFPGAYRIWFAEMARVLRPGGRVVLRVYVAPDAAESPATVIDDLTHGRIGNANVLRMRLFMALQRQAATGIELSDLADYWSSLAIEKKTLTAKFGWPAAEIDIFDMFKALNLRYSFPTWRELEETFSGCFAELERHIPGYEIGGRCPTIVLEKIGR